MNENEGKLFRPQIVHSCIILIVYHLGQPLSHDFFDEFAIKFTIKTKLDTGYNKKDFIKIKS